MSHRIRILYSGRVQGVGFRATTARLAGRHEVSGFVRNLPDGRVELVAEGDPAEVERLVAAVAERMGGHIDAVEREAGPATAEFRSFAVRH